MTNEAGILSRTVCEAEAWILKGCELRLKREVGDGC